MATAAGEAGSEAPIAAFAVAKGGVVLKNIFLNAPPTDETRRGGDGDGEVEVGEGDPPVLFGRHPDCHVLVDHPSVSRFHLEVRSQRRRRRITVTDLSSVHGTWVSGRRIPANTPVELAAGDTLRLGGSKREYRLHWLSLPEAFEMEDSLPPLLEEDKEEFRTYQEANKQSVPLESVGMETHEETSQQVVSEQISFCAKVIPSAPPLPEQHSFSLKESSLSQSDENREGVIEEKLIDENPITESVGSSIIQAIPATVTNSGASVQSDKRGASSTMSRGGKLKSVKSLRIDTGRTKERSITLSYIHQKEEAQNENLVCSQKCGRECAACMALFDDSDVKKAEEKEKIIAPDKDHMNSLVLDRITMEGNQEVPNPLGSKEYMQYVSPLNLEHDTFSDKENSMLNVAKETEQDDLFSENSIPQDSVDAKLQHRLEFLGSVSPSVLTDDTFKDKMAQLGAITHMESYEPVSEDHFMQEVIGDNMNSHEDMKLNGFSHLKLDGDISINDYMAQNKVVLGPEDCEHEGTFGSICGDLLDKENATPYVSGNIIAERSQLSLKPTISQELMDSISPLNLEHDNFSDNENTMLNIGKQMKASELVSESLVPLSSVDEKLQKSQPEFMPISHLDFEIDILPNKENLVQTREKYDAISPVRQGDLFPDKENVTPASRDLKPINRKVLVSNMDSSESAEYTSNRSIHKRECSELSAKSKGFHTVDDEAFYSDKENLTPLSSGGMKARRCLPKNLFTVNVDQDQEAFYSDKENSTPVSSAAPITRYMSENRARIESAITKKRVVDRFPFQTLLSNSPLRHISSLDCTHANARAADVAIRLEDELNILPHKNQESDRVGEGMKVWTMVTDTDCLLDDKSRKSIMLLKGLKGTRLIIPWIVIRELDCMKQREGLFRRSSKATSILQWIDECMENESWWIHVQGSSEMLPVAPTPPATPTIQCNDEEREATASTFNPMAFFSPRSFADIASPRTEDRILDCGLLFNKLRSNQNIVILSNSITLKIKAMAEGLLCEGAKEFRETLVNPCSSRFMWAASAPRGSAWSCLDEAALAENYYNSHHGARRRIPRSVEAAKGLKLILLHNSLYAQATNSVVKKTPLAPLTSS